MSENYNDSVHHGYEEEVRVNLMPPASLTTPLWKSLFAQAKERISPERLPPIQITSHPVDVGMLVGESVSLPWYRTIFVNLGNVIAPETLPPLELESHPVDIGVLISDQMGVPWYSSLIASLKDRISPEKLPDLEISSKPVDPRQEDDKMELPRWSNLIDAPKLFLPDRTRQGREGEEVYRPTIMRPLPPPPPPSPADIEFNRILLIQRSKALRNSRVRQVVWVGVVLVEVGFLLGEVFVK